MRFAISVCNSFEGLNKLSLKICLFSENGLLFVIFLATTWFLADSVFGSERAVITVVTLSLLNLPNKVYCYIAGIFFPTARALIGYFEVA